MHKPRTGWHKLCDEAERGVPKALKQLIMEGGDVHERTTTDGYTPLHLACIYGHLDCAQILIEARADVNAQDDMNCTPLHMAASEGRLNCVAILLHTAADIDAEDINQETPLHHAAASDGPENSQNLCAHALVEAGADLEVVNIEGKTAREKAEEAGHLEIAWFIQTTFTARKLRRAKWLSFPSRERMRVIKSAIDHRIIVTNKRLLIIDGHCDIPPMMTRIPENCFQQCMELKTCAIHPGVVELAQQAFTDCHNLLYVSIPETVRYIGTNCFLCCKSLQTCVVPDTTRLEPDAFDKKYTRQSFWAEEKESGRSKLWSHPGYMGKIAKEVEAGVERARMNPVDRRWT